KLPVFGPIIKKINLAKFARTLSSLIKTDIPIVKSFEITSQILGNRIYKKSLLESVEAVKSGTSLTEVLKKYPKLYPPIIVQMTAAGEETGTVDEVLAELANFYEDEIDQVMKTLPSIIEPILILVLGSAVALMAVAIIMPMYSLTQHIN
ncbi:MAG TPA: type II secretion system F family protein, partial [Patescibacteria group bacterium]|nr:type II secretion system F family protein [Patescibacteria group bacterium]